jgi:hypothetical protein
MTLSNSSFKKYEKKDSRETLKSDPIPSFPKILRETLESEKFGDSG